MNGLLFSLARHADHLLRRRDRHGRQHLSRRPQRRAHPDAVGRRPQRRVLPGQSPAALPAGRHRPRVPRPGGQRRGPAGEPELAAVVDEAADRAAQPLPGVRRGARFEILPSRQPQGARLPAALRGRADPGGGQPLPLRPVRRARPVRVPRGHPGRAVRQHRVPGRRRPALLRHPRSPRLLLVRARAPRPSSPTCPRGSFTVRGQLGRAVRRCRPSAGSRRPARLPRRTPLVRGTRPGRSLGRAWSTPSRSSGRRAPRERAAGPFRHRAGGARPREPRALLLLPTGLRRRGQRPRRSTMAARGDHAPICAPAARTGCSTTPSGSPTSPGPCSRCVEAPPAAGRAVVGLSGVPTPSLPLGYGSGSPSIRHRFPSPPSSRTPRSPSATRPS